MARFYRMAVMPNLFGEWTLYREWGRIGQGGQVRMDWFEDENQAVAALVTTGSLQASARLLDGASAARDVQMIA
ncbi:WGR domain-containing protein (plasmid) [Pseudosulfitobacter pseudonitzschiae]|nr:WGR domain-containing protein [Pseudosulfitobacter pseudonitzschiae]